MRFRSVALVVAMSGLLAASLVRCTLPELPPGPQANPTKERVARGAFLSLPGAPVDRAALVASLKELKFTTIILDPSASAEGEQVNERVAFAVELQRELDATVFIGTYRSSAGNGAPMEALLQKDPAFTTCYPSSGLRLDAEASLIDKIRLCSQDVSTKIVAALRAVSASPRIGCFIAQQPELVDSLPSEDRAKLEAFFRDSAGPCAEDKRFVGVSPFLSPRSGDPDRAAVLLRESLRDAAVNVVMLQDGVAIDPPQPGRVTGYYQGLRNALADRPLARAPSGGELRPVEVWAAVDAFECETPSCVRTHPATIERFTEQLCKAQRRVDRIVTREYLRDLAGRSLFASTQDASVDVQAILDDTDAAAQLRRGYLEWSGDAGARCP